MYPILEKRCLAKGIYLMKVLAPRVAHAARDSSSSCVPTNTASAYR